MVSLPGCRGAHKGRAVDAWMDPCSQRGMNPLLHLQCTPAVLGGAHGCKGLILTPPKGSVKALLRGKQHLQAQRNASVLWSWEAPRVFIAPRKPRGGRNHPKELLQRAAQLPGEGGGGVTPNPGVPQSCGMGQGGLWGSGHSGLGILEGFSSLCDSVIPRWREIPVCPHEIQQQHNSLTLISVPGDPPPPPGYSPRSAAACSPQQQGCSTCVTTHSSALPPTPAGSTELKQESPEMTIQAPSWPCCSK